MMELSKRPVNRKAFRESTTTKGEKVVDTVINQLISDGTLEAYIDGKRKMLRLVVS
jgi:hypothetical protein